MTTATLPLRRTWLASELKRQSIGGTFLRLLEALAPEKARRARAETPIYIYTILMSHLGTLFPVFMPELEDWDQEAGQPARDEAEIALDYGLPIDFYGLPDSHLFGDKYANPVEALVFWLVPDQGANDISKDDVVKYGRLEQVPPESLKDLWPRSGLFPLSAGQARIRFTAPPRGRQWKGVWAGLPDLYAYVTHSTGSSILDYTMDDVYESGDLPPFDLDEIRGAAQAWKLGEPIWKRLTALKEYIGGDSRRLLELGRALTGDPETRQCLSEPKRPGKTLADLFTARK